MPDEETEPPQPFWLSPYPFREPDLPPPDDDGE